MNFILKEDSGAFKSYLKEVMKRDITKYMRFKKTLIYLPADTNLMVAEKLIDLIKPKVKSVILDKAKSGNYCYKIEYHDSKKTTKTKEKK